MRRRITPGKAELPLETHFRAFEDALAVFGRNRVGTYVILGLGEDRRLTLDHGRELVRMGIYLKGKSAIEIAKRFERVRKITGASFWARGYFASTVGIGEREIRLYIRNQEKEDRQAEQLKLL